MQNRKRRPLQRSRSRAPAFLLMVLTAGVVLTACSDTPSAPVISLPEPTQPPQTTTTAEVVDEIEQPSSDIVVKPGMDLEAMVADAPEGSSFLLLDGIHRGHRIEPKDGMTFIGEEGAVMTGADLLSGFRVEGDHWRLDDVTPDARNHGQCVEGYEGCYFTQDLFMDDVMLWQVTDMEDLGSGRWLWDGDAVVVADDPTLRRVELSVVPYAFRGTADDVEIRNLVVEKYATPAQAGAIQAQAPAEGPKGERWTIDNVEVSGVHGVAIRAGDHTVIRNAHIHHNGQLGVTGAGGVGLLIVDSEIAHNNVAGFRWPWEAGGVKLTNSEGAVLRGNVVHHNNGPGLWADIDTVDTLFEDNLVRDNGGPGIFHEISYGAVVRNNTVERNGFDDDSWLWGAGILVAGSSDVEVYGNLVRDNGNGITGVQQERGEGRYGPRLLTNLYVHDNTVRLSGGRVGIVQDVGDDAVFTSRNNRFASNTYTDAEGFSFTWNGRRLDRVGWISAGQDVDGIWE